MGHVTAARVVLDDLLVGHAGEKFVRGHGVDFDDVRDARRADSRGTFAGFGVPSGDIFSSLGTREGSETRLTI